MLELATRNTDTKLAKLERSALVTPAMASTLLLSSDVMSLSLGLLLVIVISGGEVSSSGLYIFIVALLLTLHLQRSARQYDINQARDHLQCVIRVVGSWGLSAAIAIAPSALLAVELSSHIFEIGLIVGISALIAGFSRLAISFWLVHLLRCGYWNSRVLIMGGGEQGQRLIHILRAGNRPVEILGLFDDRFDRLPADIETVPVLGGIDDLMTFARRYAVDEVIVALPKRADKRLAEWFRKLSTLPIRITHCQDVPLTHEAKPLTTLFGFPAAQLSRKPLEGWGSIAKEVEDRLFAAIGLVLVSPLMLAIALAIKLSSPGPVLFRQSRFGFNNNEIDVLKFRTMKVHDGPLEQAKRHDPRITPLGRFLRKTSLDELPQLINVLRGEMSLVGPRPHAVAHNEIYARSIDRYLCRHRVKPGITGWAQVNGWRGETDTIEKMEARVAHDLYYIERWSLFFDIKIILKTLVVGFRHPNAY